MYYTVQASWGRNKAWQNVILWRNGITVQYCTRTVSGTWTWCSHPVKMVQIKSFIKSLSNVKWLWWLSMDRRPSMDRYLTRVCVSMDRKGKALYACVSWLCVLDSAFVSLQSRFLYRTVPHTTQYVYSNDKLLTGWGTGEGWKPTLLWNTAHVIHRQVGCSSPLGCTFHLEIAKCKLEALRRAWHSVVPV